MEIIDELAKKQKAAAAAVKKSASKPTQSGTITSTGVPKTPASKCEKMEAQAGLHRSFFL